MRISEHWYEYTACFCASVHCVVDDVSSTGAVAAAAEAAAAVWQLECVIVAAPGRRLATPAGEGHVEAS